MEKNEKNYWKVSLVLVLCLLARLVPFRVPNVEPILAATMPLSRSFGALLGSTFAVLSVLFYDVLTGTLGLQTFFTVGAFGLLGWWSAIYFKKNRGERWGYVRFAIFGTLFFDAVTGLTVGPIFFGQSFLGSLMGQIPFTALHLLGNIIFAMLLSPALYNFYIRKRKKSVETQASFLNPKII